MLNLFIKILGVLKADTALTAIVPANNMLVGNVDIVSEAQDTLMYPQVLLFQVTEVTNTVPKNTRDTTIQLDIISNNSQLEVENIYDLIIADLNYLSGNQGSNHLFWQVVQGAVDQVGGDSTRRYWQRSLTIRAWDQ